jgi:hypothetical protein
MIHIPRLMYRPPLATALSQMRMAQGAVFKEVTAMSRFLVRLSSLMLATPSSRPSVPSSLRGTGLWLVSGNGARLGRSLAKAL